MFEPLKAMECIVGFNRKNLHLGILLFEIAPSAHDRATGTYPCDKMGDLPLRLRPQLRASGFVMCQWVGLIKILVWFKVAFRVFV